MDRTVNVADKVTLDAVKADTTELLKKTLEIITDLDPQSLGGVGESIKNIYDSVNNIVNTMAKEATLTGVKTDISNLSTAVSGVKTDVSGVKTDVSGVKTDTGNLLSKLAELASKTPIPTQSFVPVANGTEQTPCFDGYDVGRMTLGGTTKGTTAGSYNATFTLKAGFKWSDGTTEVKTVAWKIVNPSNAPKLITPRNISLSGAVTGTATPFDGSKDIVIPTSIANMTGASTSAAGKAGLVPAPGQGNANRYLRSDGKWEVPPDNNTTYPTFTGTVTPGLVPARNGNTTTKYLREDGTWQTPPDNNTTYPTFSGTTTPGLVPARSGSTTTKYLREDGAWQTPPNTTYSNMTGASTDAAGKAGLVPAPTAGAANRYLRSDGSWQVPPNTTYNNMTGASTSAAGKAGLVPAPDKGNANRYLRSDGTWQVPPDNNTTYPTFTGTTTPGLVPARSGSTTTKYLREDGTWQTPPDNNTTYSNMTGASANAAGKAGLVPAPEKGDANRYLRSDGTWQIPPDTKYSHPTSGVTANSYGPSANATPAAGSAFNVPYITVDAQGHVTAAKTNTVKMPAAPTLSGLGGQKKATIVSATLGGSSNWASDTKTQKITVTGVLSNESSQLIIPIPLLSSLSNYINAGVRCTAQSTNALTFTCNSIPSSSISLRIVIFDLT